MRHLSGLAISCGLALALNGCAISREEIKGELESAAWLMQSSGKLAGARVHQDLQYPSLGTLPSVDGSLTVRHSKIEADWVQVDASGSGRGGFTWDGNKIPAGDAFTSHFKLGLSRATYGYVFGDRRFSVAPVIGVSYTSASTDVIERSVIAVPKKPSMIIVTPSSNSDRQFFPVLGLDLGSSPLSWLDVRAQAVGIGADSGAVIDTQLKLLMHRSYFSGDLGYRAIIIDSGDTQLVFRGFMLGAGVRF
jgi:hypothetical protein